MADPAQDQLARLERRLIALEAQVADFQRARQRGRRRAAKTAEKRASDAKYYPTELQRARIKRILAGKL